MLFMTAAASLTSARNADVFARQGARDANLGRPMLPPPGRSNAASYRAGYRAARAAR